MISIGLLIMSFTQAHIYKYIYLYIYFPGTQSPIHHTNFMYALDDSLDTFMHQTKKWKLILTNDNNAPEYEVKTDDNDNENRYNSKNNKVPE